MYIWGVVKLTTKLIFIEISLTSYYTIQHCFILVCRNAQKAMGWRPWYLYGIMAFTALSDEWKKGRETFVLQWDNDDWKWISKCEYVHILRPIPLMWLKSLFKNICKVKKSVAVEFVNGFVQGSTANTPIWRQTVLCTWPTGKWDSSTWCVRSTVQWRCSQDLCDLEYCSCYG